MTHKLVGQLIVNKLNEANSKLLSQVNTALDMDNPKLRGYKNLSRADLNK